MSQSPRTRLSPDDRKAQLLDCAIKAFADIGIERAGHGDVAKLADVSTATVFNYFPTREALVDAVLAEIGHKVMTMFGSVPDSDAPPSEQILLLADAYGKMTDQYPDLSKVFLNWSVSFSSDLREKHLAFEEVIINEIMRRLNHRDDRTDARIILSTANSYAIMKLDGTDADVIQRFVERVAEIIR